jgi:hypothetical protein
MSRDDKIELVGRFWDSLTTGQKIGFCLIVPTCLGIAFGSGYWFSHAIDESRMAATEVKHQMALLELQRKIDQQTTPRLSIRLFHGGEENVPKLSEAKASDLSMAAFANLAAQPNSALFPPRTHLTSLQQPKYVDPYTNKSYRWTGYISDVRMEGGNEEPEYLVDMRLDNQQKNGFSVTCVFEGRIYE